VLSANNEATLHVESLINDLDVSGSMKRDEFEELIQPLIGRIKAVIEKVSRRCLWTRLVRLHCAQTCRWLPAGLRRRGPHELS